MLVILVIVLLVLAFGSAPTWGYHTYGWYPPSILGLIVVVLLVWLLMGRL